jgi:Tol biopolymer transport system component
VPGHRAARAFITVGLLALPVAPPRARPSEATPSKQIVYTYDGAIHVINPDGTGDMSLESYGSTPEWSPDRGRIAFYSTRDDPNGDIFVMNADGSDQVNLTGRRGFRRDLYPTWSPDGTKIAFCGDTANALFTVWVVDLVAHVMSSVGGSTLNCSGVTWSPDGSTIVFSADYGTLHFALYAVNPDGSNFRVLVNTDGNDLWPDWSPDGKHLVFEQYTGYALITISGSAGAGLKVVSPPSAIDWFPVWSPDGKQIAFDRHNDMWIMNADGSDRHDITPDDHLQDWPDW